MVGTGRSMTLDSWNKKYITFLEKGGNQNFLEFVRKFGLIGANTREIDYKNPAIQQYKQQLGKQVDDELKQDLIENHQILQKMKEILVTQSQSTDLLINFSFFLYNVLNCDQGYHPDYDQVTGKI